MKAETFQEPSMLMKRALFMALLFGAVAVVLYMFCVEPWQSDLQKARKEYLGLQDQRNRMINDLKGASQVGARLNVITNECQTNYINNLLGKSVGSYGTAALSKLKPLAEDVGLTIGVDLVEPPPRRLPLPVPLSPQLYERRPIRLTCTGSYAAIVSFILRVEQEMPLVALEAFSFKAQKDPDNQLATMVFEWPCKGENIAATAKGGVKK